MAEYKMPDYNYSKKQVNEITYTKEEVRLKELQAYKDGYRDGYRDGRDDA